MGFLQPPARTISVAFLGASHSHARPKIDYVRNSPLFRLAGVVEEDPKLRDEYARLGVTLRTRAEILDDPGIELIAVESDVPRHERDGLDALKAGKHVHLEKPPADNLAGMRALLDESRRRKRLLQPGYMWRHHPGINHMLDIARKGQLGEIYLVRGTMNTLVDDASRRQWSRFAGGQMFEQGGHLLDPITRLMGRPLNIQSTLRHHGGNADTLKDNTVAVLEYPRALAVVTSAVLQPNANVYRSLEIFGSKGTAVLRPIEPPVLEVDRVRVELPPFRRYEGDFLEMHRCISNGQPLSVTAEEDLLVQQVLLQAGQM